jgi:hypothetical protein
MSKIKLEYIWLDGLPITNSFQRSEPSKRPISEEAEDVNTGK